MDEIEATRAYASGVNETLSMLAALLLGRVIDDGELAKAMEDLKADLLRRHGQRGATHIAAVDQFLDLLGLLGSPDPDAPRPVQRLRLIQGGRS